MKHLLSIDLAKCTGCRNCELACSATHTKTFSPARARIQVLKDEQRNIVIPVVCLQCEHPLCREACPSGAIIENAHGILYVAEEDCIGCMSCVTACIYGGIAIDTVSRKAMKCNLCDGEPACLAACPYDAIFYMPQNTDGIESRYAQSRELPRALGLIKEEI